MQAAASLVRGLARAGDTRAAVQKAGGTTANMAP